MRSVYVVYVVSAAAAAGGIDQEDDTGVAEVKVAMPFTLKKQLVTDWENVTQEPKRLVKLPRELTAADVMSQYMTSKADRSTAPQIARAQELIDGVRIYFDKVRMSDLLLYGLLLSLLLWLVWLLLLLAVMLLLLFWLWLLVLIVVTMML